MSRKRYYLLVRCLCVMLCCITFLATSLTTNAAVGDTFSFEYVNTNGTDIVSYISGSPTTQTYYSPTGNILPDSYSGSTNFDSVFFIEKSDSYFEPNAYYKCVAYFNIHPRVTHNGSSAVGVRCDVSPYISFDKYNSIFKVELVNNVSPVSTNYGNVFYFKGSDLIDGKLRIPLILHCGFTVSNSSTSDIFVAVDLSYKCNFTKISQSAYDSTQHSSNVTDPTQNALTQQGNDLQQQNNQVTQDTNTTTHDTNNKITSFFNSFFDNLIGIFVPESGFFSQWFNDLNDFMGQKLGFLWSPFDFVLTFLDTIYNGSNSYDLVFPQVAWLDGTILIPETHLNFENIGGQSFPELREAIYIGFDIAMLGWVLTLVYKKLSMVFGGDSSDN